MFTLDAMFRIPEIAETTQFEQALTKTYRIGHAVSSRKRVDIIAKAKALGVKVTNAKGRVTTEA